MISMDDLSLAQREAIERAILPLVNRAMENAAGALRAAGLDVTLAVERFDDRFDIVLHCTLPPAQRKLAEDICNAALESVILQASVDGRLH